MPHDIMPIELSPDDSAESATADTGATIHHDSGGIFSTMKDAGRALMKKTGRIGGKGILATMMAAGAALCSTPAHAYLTCTVNGLGDIVCREVYPNGPGTLGGGGGGAVYGGDPVNIATGSVYLHLGDYKTAGQNPLAFERYYNSNGNQVGASTGATEMGVNWRMTYDRYLYISPSSSPTTVVAERADGQQITFANSGGSWVTDSDIDYRLTRSGTTWTLTGPDDSVESYADNGGGTGLLNTITARNGYEQTISRSGGQIASVTDSYGRTLSFTYSGGLLQSVTTPDTVVLTFGYTAIPVVGGSNLTSVSYNTSPATSQTYAYANSLTYSDGVYTGSPYGNLYPSALASITDENGHVSASWTYNGGGQVLTSQNGGSLGANLTTFTYNSDGSSDGSITVTNPFGVADTYTFIDVNGRPKLQNISRASTSTTAAATESFGYDTNGYMNNVTDWNSNQTTTVNNAQGHPTTINEAVGSTVARTTTVSYDPTWIRLPHQIVTPGLTSTFAYDGSGNPLTRTDTDTTTNSIPYSTSGQTRATQFTWSSTGELTSVQLPRTDATVKTTLGYDGTGALTSITDPLSHVTHITAHTPGGYPTTIVDPNSVTTTLGWDARLNLNTATLATTAGNLTTTYTHDKANNLTAIQLPDNSKLTLGYDTANRLTTVTDLNGNTVNYTLDALGDATMVQAKNSSGTKKWQDAATFDALGRSQTNTDGGGFATTFTWDANSNLLTVAPPGPSGTTTFTYDALNRTATKVDPTGGGTTTITLDAHNRVTNVQDPKGNSTAYTRDGFGDTTQLASPDSGTSIFTYNKDSKLTQKVFGGGQTVNLTYDAKDRNLTVSFPADSTLNISKTYDQTTGHGFGVGRLTSVTDQVGSDGFTYDERANITNESRVVTGVGTLTTGTTFDADSRVASIAYPSGTVVDYSRDTMGNVTGITAKPAGASSFSNVATSITHAPFGPETALTFGNGITGAYGYDWAYRMTSRVDTATAGAVLNHTQGYYANSSLLWRHDNINAANSVSFGYDAMDRMTGAVSGTGGFGTYGWTWDANGNVASQTINGTTANFNLTSGTNQLANTLTAGTVKYYNNNANGDLATVTQGVYTLDTYNYNAANQMASGTGSLGASATYKYGFDGQRIEKAPPGTNPILYQYARAANELLAENDLHNGQTADYIYMDPGRNSRPIGEVNPATGSLYFMHTDSMGTPQKVTGASQNTVWTASYLPFGYTASFSGTLTTQSLRLPGQQFDPETGLLHNGFRDYAAGLTRYVESDPIGLAGGMNTYQYVSGNPFKYTDRRGLDPNSSGQSSGGSCPAGGASAGFAAAGAAVTGVGGSCAPPPPAGGGGGGQCTAGSTDPMCATGGGSFMLTIGYSAISGGLAGLRDFGIGGDSSGNICIVADLCRANGQDGTFAIGNAWSAGGSYTSTQGTFETGSSTTFSTQYWGSAGLLSSVGGSVTVGPDGQLTSYGSGIPTERGGIGQGTGFTRSHCSTYSQCWKPNF